MCEKSVAQSDTGPVTISLRVPSGTSSGRSLKSRANRSSTVMSGLLEEFDRAFRAVGNRETSLALLVGRDYAVTEDRAQAFLVVTEQVRGEVVAPAVPLADVGVDLQLHCASSLWACSVWAVSVGAELRARPAMTRASSLAHSSSSTACRSGVTSALPMDNSRQKWASAFGDRPESISPSDWATCVRPESQSSCSPI